MSVDLATLISGAGSDLNQDLAIVNPAGESIFKKAFGAQTSYRTETGIISVKFFFDPNQPYEPTSILASITTDYIGEMRTQLTKYLLDPKDIAPERSSLEEEIWEEYKKQLGPQGVRILFSDSKRLEEYLAVIRRSTEASYREGEALTQALTTRNFDFTFRVAIDAFPQNLQAEDRSLLEKTGVITFRIEGRPDQKKLPKKEDGSPEASIVVVDPEKEKSKGKDKDKDGKKEKIRRKRKAAFDESLQDLMRELGIEPEELSKGHVVSDKKFPATANEFFEQLGSWFQTVVQSKSMAIGQSGTKPGMYH